MKWNAVSSETYGKPPCCTRLGFFLFVCFFSKTILTTIRALR